MATNYDSLLVISNDATTERKRNLSANNTPNRFLFLQALTNYLGGLRSESRKATVISKVGLVKATGTFTFSGAASNNDTVLINGVTFTAKTSGATGNQWNIGSNATQTAANLAAAINASVTALVQGYVVASSAVGVVTVTAAQGGILGNAITIAKGTDAGSVDTVSGARLTGGTDGTSQTYYYGGSSLS